MLNKKLRLKNERNFRFVYKRGRNIPGRFVNIKYTPEKKDVKKFGIVVGKKIDNRATVRNKIKRQISSIINGLIKDRPLAVKLIINVKKIPDDFQVLKEDINTCFDKID